MCGIAVTAALLASGCGGSSSDAVTVQAGTLTKAAFTSRADAICQATHTQFYRDFANYYHGHSLNDVGSEKTWDEEIIKRAVVPNYGTRMIDEISTLGVPHSETQKVTVFLEAVKQRVHELEENPLELNETPYPFKTVAALAKKYGLAGCSEAFG